MLSDNNIYYTRMDPEKAEFKRLIELMGWSQTEAARRLHKSPSAINHLVNPAHPNKPTRTMMQLLHIIMASERPDLPNPQASGPKGAAKGGKPDVFRLSPRERGLIERLRRVPRTDKDKVYAIIEALLRSIEPREGKSKKP
jgi:transcriptional regulator with XRE-family HTH domain